MGYKQVSIVPKKPNIQHGFKAEKKLNKRLGGRETFASGALVFDKSDVVVDDFRVECKSTIKDSISIKRGYLIKVTAEAQDHVQDPALFIQFVTENGQPRDNGSWALIREREFQELLWLRKKYKEELDNQ